MAEAQLVIDNVSLAGSGGVESATFDAESKQFGASADFQEYVVVIQADANGSNLDLSVRTYYDGTSGQAVALDQAGADENSYTGLDATTWDQAVLVVAPAADQLEIVVTNQNASASTVSVWVVPHRK